jgi:hypothetical protein
MATSTANVAARLSVTVQVHTPFLVWPGMRLAEVKSTAADVALDIVKLAYPDLNAHAYV